MATPAQQAEPIVEAVATEVHDPVTAGLSDQALQSRPMKALRWIAVVAALVAVVVVLRLTVLVPDPVEVRTAIVEPGLVEQTVTNTRAGTVKVRFRASLSPQLGGLVMVLPFREGSRVDKGAVLLQLDNRAQLAELTLARSSVTTALAQAEESCLAAELSETELRRVESLHAGGIASDQSLDGLRTDRDRSRAACGAARAAVTQAEARVSLAEVQLRFTRIVAPFSGIVADVSTEVGEWITPSPPGVPIPPVIDLLDPASVYISAPIDEVDSELVRVGQPVRISVDSRPDTTFSGRVARVAPYVLDNLEQNRTVEVEAAFDDDAAVAGILPGTSADVEVILERHENVLRLPAASVGDGGRVLVLTDGLLEERIISTGLRNWEWIEVVDGLSQGEVVAVSRDSTEIRAGVEAVAKAE